MSATVDASTEELAKPYAPPTEAGIENPTGGFLPLIITQFFGAMNDNVLKGVLTFMVIDGAWRGDLGTGGQGIVGICFTLPFILLSGYAGQFADRYSKTGVAWWVKLVEIPIAIVAGIGFFTGQLWITMAALVALTCQSSFFGPAKYGMIPELVGDQKLSKANGTINMMTNLAVIIGTLVAGFVSDAYAPQDIGGAAAEPIGWLPAAVLIVIAVAGFAAANTMPRLAAGRRDLPFDWNPLSTYIQTIGEMSRTRLLMIMMAWGYFYFLAGIALFILPEYTLVLDINRANASVLMGVMGVAVGIGCAVAGMVSGDGIRPRLIPIGAAGLVLFFALLGWVTPKLGPGQGMVAVATSNVSLFVLGAGFSAGFYIVPLQALLQKLSPGSARGRYLGTANGVSFAFMTLSAILYTVVRSGFGDAPHQMFLLCSLLMALGTAFFLYRLRGEKIVDERSAVVN